MLWSVEVCIQPPLATTVGCVAFPGFIQPPDGLSWARGEDTPCHSGQSCELSTISLRCHTSVCCVGGEPVTAHGEKHDVLWEQRIAFIPVGSVYE